MIFLIRRIFLSLFIFLVVLLSELGIGFGTTYVDDVKQYGEWESYLEIPFFMPEDISDYTVNAYSYTLYSYLDVCYEIFLDVTVSEEQFEELISGAKANGEYTEKEAYYQDGYFEIVFEDNYRVFYNETDDIQNVGWADIEKIVYNPQTLNIVFVCFHANDTGVYALDDVAYFNRFSIDEEEYSDSVQMQNETCGIAEG